jgi:hypothetical protein
MMGEFSGRLKKKMFVGLFVFKYSLAIMFVFIVETNSSDRKTIVFFFTYFYSVGVGGTYSVLACRLYY